MKASNVATYLVLAVILAWGLSFTVFGKRTHEHLNAHTNAMIEKYCMNGGKIDMRRDSCYRWVNGEQQEGQTFWQALTE